MAELERIANHFGDIGAICNDASFSILLRRLRHPARARAAHRGRVLRPSADDGPHRPGRRRARHRTRRYRAASGADRDGPRQVPRAGRGLRQHRLAAGPHRDDRLSLARRLARAFGAGGYVGRASGRAFDARKAVRLSALRRARIRGAGARRRRCQCARLDPHPRGRAEPEADRADRRSACPQGRPRAELPQGWRGPRRAWRWSRPFAATCSSGCGIGADGRIERCHLRDPSWFQWPLLEACVEGNIVADFPLCNKSFNCSYSGHDL